MAKLEGLPIVDATRPLRLKVEPSDINRRARKSPSHCALAECASRMYKTEARVYMTRAYIKSADGQSWTRYQIPGTAQREITAFDRGAAFEPGDYRLTAPAPQNRLGVKHIQKRTGKGENHKTAPHHMTLNVRRRAPIVPTGRETN